MADVNTHASNVRLVGGRLCLDFVNTVDSHLKAQPKEYLVDYAALVAWGCHAGMLGQPEAAELLRQAALRPRVAADVLLRAKELRAALYQLFAAIAGARGLAGTPGAPQPALAALNQALAAAPRRSHVIAAGHGYSWACDAGADPLERPLLLVLWSAADLLTAAEAAYVGQCEGAGCSWLFLDTSPKRGRRWCSMEDCGNRAKARRHYARRQAPDSEAASIQIRNVKRET